MANGSRTAEECLDLAEERLTALEASLGARVHSAGATDPTLILAIVTAWRKLGQARLELTRYKDWVEQ